MKENNANIYAGSLYLPILIIFLLLTFGNLTDIERAADVYFMATCSPLFALNFIVKKECPKENKYPHALRLLTNGVYFWYYIFVFTK